MENLEKQPDLNGKQEQNIPDPEPKHDQELEFQPGQSVCLLNPKTKQFEYGWQVGDFGIDVVQIINIKTQKQAVVPLEELKAWNDETTFLPGHQVFLKQDDPIPSPGWEVQAVDNESGEVTIFNPDQDKTETVPVDQLIKDFAPQTNRYTPIRNIKK
ncbi:hypothetical protein ACFL2U_01390 [Patescibacteria group bacterium]